MSPRTSRVSYFFLGLGIGMLLSILLPGWFARFLVGVVLIVIGCLISNCS